MMMLSITMENNAMSERYEQKFLAFPFNLIIIDWFFGFLLNFRSLSRFADTEMSIERKRAETISKFVVMEEIQY